MSTPIFEDIVWGQNPNDEDCVVGLLTLANGITVSVAVGGLVAGGGGVETFEVAAWDEGGHWLALTPFDTVMAFCDREQVEDVIRRLQLNKG